MPKTEREGNAIATQHRHAALAIESRVTGFVQKDKKLVLSTAMTIAKLRADEPVTAKAVDAWLASSGTKQGEVRAHLLRTRFAWVAVLIDPKTAMPVKMLLGEKIGD